MLSYGGGTDNVLAVCADTSAQPASRWYAGAGIYRHVRLVVTDPVHICDGRRVCDDAQNSAARGHGADCKPP